LWNVVDLQAPPSDAKKRKQWGFRPQSLLFEWGKC
jgi:hypothetical protein